MSSSSNFRGAALQANRGDSRGATGPLNAALRILTLCVLVAGVVSAVWRGLRERPDWSEFLSESRYVYEHGRSAPGTALFGYLPAVPVLLWPFTAWLPNAAGLPLFVASNVVSLAVCIWAVRRWWIRSDSSGLALSLALAVCSVNLGQALQSNQLTLWPLALMVCGLGLAGARREWWAGVLLGAAVVIKTVPILLAGYLIFARKWRALTAMGLSALALDGSVCLLAYGPEGTLREHKDWLRRVKWHSSAVQIDDPLLRVHRHGSNQSFSVVLARWLREMPAQPRQVIVKGSAPADVLEHVRFELGPDEVISLDPMPPREVEWEILRKDISWAPRFHIASLSAGTVRAIWVTCLALGFLGISAFTVVSRAAHADSWQPVAALWVLGLFWPSPMMRDYYLAWVLPVLAVLADAWVTRPLARGRWVASIALVAWVIGLACLGLRTAMWYGAHLAVLAVLAAGVVWAWTLQPVGKVGPNRENLGGSQ